MTLKDSRYRTGTAGIDRKRSGRRFHPFHAQEILLLLVWIFLYILNVCKRAIRSVTLVNLCYTKLALVLLILLRRRGIVIKGSMILVTQTVRVYVRVCVCVCVFIKLHITAQSGL